MVGTLNLREHTTQISETGGMAKALNKRMKLGMLHTKAIVS
ncbi:hypothetical protein BTN50_1173 [Candidatus Enterovibrio altilux]|uniref:Uncharacterized protein n=1 Tax=Candidatus Enterovibrio altilux TaxID=1927128 RepID=A0A291B9L3_9GAMM|nr:hypothetical protein BTN50_1173 [Candidatus Enterovibrio luxaltus]